MELEITPMFLDFSVEIVMIKLARVAIFLPVRPLTWESVIQLNLTFTFALMLVFRYFILSWIVIICSIGNIASLSLSRLVGRQQLRGGWAAAIDVPVVSHVRTLYTLGIHPGAGVLRPFSRLPSTVPSGRPWAGFGRGISHERRDVNLWRTWPLSDHGACGPGPQQHPSHHVLCLNQQRNDLLPKFSTLGARPLIYQELFSI